MQKRVLAGAVLAAIFGAALWSLLRGSAAAPAPHPAHVANVPGQYALRALPQAAASASQHSLTPAVLRGRVTGPDGPVAGATVTALAMQDPNALPARDCTCNMHCNRKLLKCACDDAAHEIARAMAER